MAGFEITGGQADLSITKTDIADPIQGTAEFYYLLSVNNAGPGEATSVTVVDSLPEELTFIGASGSGWSCSENGGVVSCTLASLAPGDAPPITIDVVAPLLGGSITNQATVSSATEDQNQTNNLAVEETYIHGCFPLSLSHNGSGADPTGWSPGSLGCPESFYELGDVVTLTPFPDPGWVVGFWSGTNAPELGQLSMPDRAHAASVTYVLPCNILTLSHTGSGSDPVANPTNSSGCTNFSEYHPGEQIQLTAVPDPDWEVGNWNGTDNDSSTLMANTLTMPASTHAASVAYVESTPQSTVGNTDVFGTTSTYNRRRALPFTMSENGTIQSISIYHNGGGGDMLLGVYDGATLPANRLAVTAQTAVSASAGWQTIDLITPVSVSSGTNFWLGWVFESSPGVRYQTGSPGRAQSGESWSGGMPDPFGSSAQASYVYSIYATYTTSVASQADLSITKTDFWDPVQGNSGFYYNSQ